MEKEVSGKKRGVIGPVQMEMELGSKACGVCELLPLLSPQGLVPGVFAEG